MSGEIMPTPATSRRPGRHCCRRPGKRAVATTSPSLLFRLEELAGGVAAEHALRGAAVAERAHDELPQTQAFTPAVLPGVEDRPAGRRGRRARRRRHAGRRNRARRGRQPGWRNRACAGRRSRGAETPAQQTPEAEASLRGDGRSRRAPRAPLFSRHASAAPSGPVSVLLLRAGPPSPCPADAGRGGAAGRSRLRRRATGAVVALVIVGAIALGAVLAARPSTSSAPTRDGQVTVYNGLPYTLPGGIGSTPSYFVSGVTAAELSPHERHRLFNNELARSRATQSGHPDSSSTSPASASEQADRPPVHPRAASCSALLVAFTSRWTVFEAQRAPEQPPDARERSRASQSSAATIVADDRHDARSPTRDRRASTGSSCAATRSGAVRVSRSASTIPTRRAPGLEAYRNGALAGTPPQHNRSSTSSRASARGATTSSPRSTPRPRRSPTRDLAGRV